MPRTHPYLSPATTGRPSPSSLPVAGSSGAVVQELVCASNAAPKTVMVDQGELRSSQLSANAGSLCIGDRSGFEGPVRKKGRVQHPALICPDFNLPNREFYDVTFKGNTFTRANMPNLQLKDVVFSGSDFSGANLLGGKFKVVDLTHCDFSWANLTDISCDRVNFRGSNFNNAQISFSQKCIEESLRAPTTCDLNCFSEKGIGNLLMCIDSINAVYKEQKNALMRSVIDHLQSVDDVAMQRHRARLEKTLFNNPHYVKEPVVDQFVYRILRLWLESKNQNAIERGELHPRTEYGELSPGTARYVRHLIDSHPFGRQKLQLMYRHAFDKYPCLR